MYNKLLVYFEHPDPRVYWQELQVANGNVAVIEFDPDTLIVRRDNEEVMQFERRDRTGTSRPFNETLWLAAALGATGAYDPGPLPELVGGDRVMKDLGYFNNMMQKSPFSRLREAMGTDVLAEVGRERRGSRKIYVVKKAISVFVRPWVEPVPGD